MHKSTLSLFAALLGVALFTRDATALDIEVPMEVPRLESLSGQVPVGVGTAQIDLSLAFDPRGRIIRDEPCFVDGAPVDVKGKLVEKRSGRRYVITATGDGMKVKLKGVLVSSGTGTAKVSYRGPRGKARATVTVDLRVVDDITSTFTLTLDDQGGGGVTTAKGRISGTATVATGYLVPSPGVGTVRGRLKNGRLKLKAKHGPAALAFKGTSAVGGGYIGTLVAKVPPDAQKLTAFSIASIGRTGGGGNTDGPLAASLRSLGVKVEDSARKDYSKTEDLPPDYAPFGSQRTFGRVNEIVMVGATLRGDASRFRVMELDVDGDLMQFADLDSPANDWVGFPGGPVTPQSLRAVCAGDVDGDGLEEIVGVYMDDLDLTLKLVEDAEQGHAETLIRLGVEQDVKGLAAVAGDFDGDGRSELAVAVCRTDSVDIVFFEDAASNFARQPALTKTYDDVLGLTNPQMYAQLRCGNLDYDIGCELAFVVNEYSSSGPAGTGRYVVLDDWSAGAAELRSGAVQGSRTG